MNRRISVSVRGVVLAALTVSALGAVPSTSFAATCADYPNQAAAQTAGDTRDADGDGIYCESLPCPCSTARPGSPTPAPPPASPAPAPTPTPPPPSPAPAPQPAPAPAPAPTPKPPAPAPATTDPPSCQTPSRVQNITFSKTKYPHIRKHFLAALRLGWPRTLVLNRPGADERRARLLEGIPTRGGQDRDEYPPAVGRGRGIGLTKGIDPRGWRAHVAYVPSRENRSHGSAMGLKLRRFCSGTKFRYVFY
jgi:hypothetical protein